MSDMTLYYSSSTDAGIVKTVNQDSIFIRIGKNKYSTYGIFAIADGMGGLSHGEVASRMTCDALNVWWDDYLPDILNSNSKNLFEDLDVSLKELFNKVNSEIYCYASQVGDKAGTTLTVLFIYNSEFLIKHIGDSRVYRIGKEVEQLTYDHTWVACQVLSGYITHEEAKNHPKRNILTQCLGVFTEVDVYTNRGIIEKEDVFLICSDGFYDKLNENDLRKGAVLLREKPSYSEELAGDLISFVKRRGERDNISLILVYPQSKSFAKTLLEMIKGISKRR
ncbi:PP2C family protein-serine/threonine phosphatase [Pseudobacteroides cellulosolvens]|uniref:Protein serine/threonine phosphatase n=1 Tax=Pseudobacteroides cellulosolvens ATCC 35603 = DSM 2933 TaxID=398512 RepID=A0A0L6JH73_9FIRM|nr:protein phosphatase 2C domain-containing protein [Pseudobacteroides cellulosolvens]KNY25074.1 protein serine/threonine phosphatase [Pseudobacteroides cellulosolvens ATCC 35603 = DSM 2933]